MTMFLNHRFSAATNVALTACHVCEQVAVLHAPQAVKAAMNANIANAVSAALLMLPQKFTAHALFSVSFQLTCLNSLCSMLCARQVMLCSVANCR